MNEAKQALLQFAYNYPVTNGNGPGRLPCADTDNDGIPNPTFGICAVEIGRLPWDQQNLNLYDIRDADGERLWYAVSENFATQTATTIRSDTSGTITVRDQSGSIIYDGSNPGVLSNYGVAAIIIAPGSITARNGVAQDRSVANADDPFDSTADTDPGIILASNYLDRVVGTEDNADFTQDSAVDGFILGPVNIQSTDAINDQMIVITAAEVIEVAEKATLQAYRTAINNYLAQTGNKYPWLYNYAGVPDVPGLSSYYPADSAGFATELITNLGNFGRIPSIFDDYFTETNSQPIESKLSVALSLTYPITPTPVGKNQLTPCCPIGSFQFNNAATHALNIQTADKLTNLRFVDIADTVGKDGQLTGTVATPELFTHEIYFWDEDSGTTGVWTMCPAGADELSDCNRDSAGNPTPGVLNDRDSEILRVVLELDFNAVVNFDTDYTIDPVISIPLAADGTRHATITATFAGADIILTSLPLSARYEYDQHYHVGDTTMDPTDSDYTTGTLDLVDLIPGTLALSMRYYPELPDWAFDNGWHDSIMMAYANDYRPDVVLGGNCGANPPCLQIIGLAGANNDKVSLLALAGEHNWVDGDLIPAVAADGSFVDEIDDVFNIENSNLDNIFDIRTVEDTGAPGDTRLDKILVIN